jgi:hypothetical protein
MLNRNPTAHDNPTNQTEIIKLGTSKVQELIIEKQISALCPPDEQEQKEFAEKMEEQKNGFWYLINRPRVPTVLLVDQTNENILSTGITLAPLPHLIPLYPSIGIIGVEQWIGALSGLAQVFLLVKWSTILRMRNVSCHILVLLICS